MHDGYKKSFSGVPALWGVDFELKAGEIHALVGENGAGKSTLIKIMTGAYRRDSGVIEYDQKTIAFQNPTEAQAAGIVAVYQEIQLVDFRTVAENIFLGREPHRFGIIDRRAMNARAADILERLGLHIDPHSVVGSLNIAHRQMVAIARAISFGARVPCSGLNLLRMEL
ncbi:ATP-binding cassette domain-containing protein [Nostoc sp. WHI]|uniref:ATP-binding cassette domain-containing protein n=1 Tax=Nostoc sp. WHI TaxID=2650611 RepID=UPI002EDB8ED7